MTAILTGVRWSLVFFFFNIYLFGCVRSLVWNAGSSNVIVACRFFSCGMQNCNCSMWDLVSRSGIKLESPVLGAWSLSHCGPPEKPWRLYNLDHDENPFTSLPCCLPSDPYQSYLKTKGSASEHAGRRVWLSGMNLVNYPMGIPSTHPFVILAIHPSTYCFTTLYDEYQLKRLQRCVYTLCSMEPSLVGDVDRLSGEWNAVW